jgi:hypothetical protein
MDPVKKLLDPMRSKQKEQLNFQLHGRPTDPEQMKSARSWLSLYE